MANPPPVLKPIVDKPRNAQDEIMSYIPLAPDEDYSIPSTSTSVPEQYVRCQLSFEDPQMDRNYKESNDAMFEVYDYLTLKLEAMFNGQSSAFPQLFTKEWDDHYSTFCPENDIKDRRRIAEIAADVDEEQSRSKTPDDRGGNKKDKKAELEEKRPRKRVQRSDKVEKAKKLKYNRD
ncbi:unnamed protein product [Toxocara canis]|uniref:Protein FAR1-RELATED SEQUENCE n=1 Tax=Toxocara canis TaxID=6265 RepID=A0A183UKQ7_TOXCA|nr:unnamed protein product [Toxocara canis]